MTTTYTDAKIEAVASALADGSALDAARLADKASAILRSLLSERRAATNFESARLAMTKFAIMVANLPPSEQDKPHD